MGLRVVVCEQPLSVAKALRDGYKANCTLFERFVAHTSSS